MKMRDPIKRLCDNFNLGYALHKIITDDDGNPIDYQYVELNRNFEDMTGMNAAEAVGKKVTEIIPDIKKDPFDWIRTYGKIALEGGYEEYVQYSDVLSKWFTIYAFSDEKGFFVTVITDSIDEGEQENILTYTSRRNDFLMNVLSSPFDDMDSLLNKYLDAAVNLTESEYGMMSFRDDVETMSYSKWNQLTSSVSRPLTKDEIKFVDDKFKKNEEVLINNTDYQNDESLSFFKRFMNMPISSGGDFQLNIFLCNKDNLYETIDLFQIRILTQSMWQFIKRMKIEKELEREKHLLGITIDSIGEGVVSLNSNGSINLINNKAVELLNVDEEYLIGQNWRKLYSDYTSNEIEKINSCFDDVFYSAADDVEIEIVNEKTGRHLMNMISLVRDTKGQKYGIVVIIADVTELRRIEAENEYKSYYDLLTNTYNRRYCEEYLNSLELSVELPLSVIFGDVDGLKFANDVFGHFAGDQLIVSTVDILRLFVGTNVIGRWGGDEFLIILPNTSEEETKKIITDIDNHVAKLHGEMRPSISLGYAIKSDDKVTVNQLIKNAESSMYMNKLSNSDKHKQYIVDSIIKKLYDTSDENERHASRLRDLAGKLAEEIDLDKSAVDNIKLAAYLHDIGKIGIEKEILDKTEKLTDEEIEKVKRHPEIGYRIVRASASLSKIDDLILSHHEFFDGSGYPRGLSGDDIPLGARIITIVDAYDAMTGNRKYREKVSNKDAIKELQELSGIQFDPDLVIAFVNKVLK